MFARSFMTIFSHINAVFAPALDILLPAQCLFCGDATKELVCAACHAYFPTLTTACQACAGPLMASQVNQCERCLAAPPPYDRLHALYSYQPPVANMLKQFKYAQQLQFANFFAGQLASLIANCSFDYLIAMPLHAERQRARGYNQAALITRALSNRTRIPLFTAVSRIKSTLPQTTLSAKARAKNLANAFQCEARLDGKRVAVIDDVLTTGATVKSISHALRKAGAAAITVYCCAKAELT